MSVLYTRLVLPKTTRGVTETGARDDVWLPKWAVAVIVVGIASLLFVLIFGITVVFKNDRDTLLRVYDDVIKTKIKMTVFRLARQPSQEQQKNTASDRTHADRPPSAQHVRHEQDRH